MIGDPAVRGYINNIRAASSRAREIEDRVLVTRLEVRVPESVASRVAAFALKQRVTQAEALRRIITKGLQHE
jgi:hypothetical protein